MGTHTLTCSVLDGQGGSATANLYIFVSSTPVITVTSTAFVASGAIPIQYSKYGADMSPPLAWSGIPSGTVSLALTCEDPDAPGGTWDHWIIYNIPATYTGLPENVATISRLTGDVLQGTNSFTDIGYGGPQPPPPTGTVHRYFFTVYALNSMLADTPGWDKNTLLLNMVGKIQAQGQLMGTYTAP